MSLTKKRNSLETVNAHHVKETTERGIMMHGKRLPNIDYKLTRRLSTLKSQSFS